MIFLNYYVFLNLYFTFKWTLVVIHNLLPFTRIKGEDCHGECGMIGKCWNDYLINWIQITSKGLLFWADPFRSRSWIKEVFKRIASIPKQVYWVQIFQAQCLLNNEGTYIARCSLRFVWRKKDFFLREVGGVWLKTGEMKGENPKASEKKSEKLEHVLQGCR